MRNFLIGIIAVVVVTTGCKKYLDVNLNPNAPQEVEAAVLLPSIQSNFGIGLQFDARFLNNYTQNWIWFQPSGDTPLRHVWQYHGYRFGADDAGDLWRNVYWRGGINLSNLISDGQKNEKWDYVGVGLVLRAWGWQMLTDLHGEMIVSEAFDPAKNVFNYDSQESIYGEVVKLSNEAIVNLRRGDGAVSQASLRRGDLIYNGDRDKWKKFAFALLAINASHLSNKAIYNPDKVISFIDSSFTSNADDALLSFTGTGSSDANPFGPLRNNLSPYAQGQFVVNLMNGTVYPGLTDPRMRIMLAPSGDGQFRGLLPGQGVSTAIPVAQRPVNLFSTTLSTSLTGTVVSKYLFTDKAPLPLITYSQLQFIKAEAYFKKGDLVNADASYKRGIESHMDFVNQNANTSSVPLIAATEKSAYVTAITSVPITLSNILMQKYIALYGFGLIETWSDLRRYDYDPDIFKTFTLPRAYFSDNNGKPAERVRPRYNSEYPWNIEALTKVGGFDKDYHTKPLWFTQP